MWHRHRILVGATIILLAGAATCFAQTPKKAPAQEENTVGITEVVKAIGEALEEAQGNNVATFPDLKSIEINLSTVATKEGGAKFRILFFSAGGGMSGEDVSTITLKMEPPSTFVRRGPPPKYKMALAAALNVAKAGIIAAKQSLPNLNVSEVGIEVAFTVKQNAEGGISVEPIAVGDIAVGGGADGKLSKSQVHKMKLVFGKRTSK